MGEVYRQRNTGVLTIEPVKLRVVIDEGQIVGVSPAPAPRPEPAPPTPEPDDSVRLKLDRILTEVGLRRKPAWPARVDEVPKVTRLRKVIEFSDPGERVVAALSAEGATATFEATTEVPADLLPTAGPTEPLILEALLTLGDTERVRKMLGDLDHHLVTTTALAEEQRTLTLTEGYLLSRIDGQCTGREILQLVPLEPAEAERTLAGLLLTGRVAQQASPARKAKPAKTPRVKTAPKRAKKPPPAEAAPPLELPLELSLEDELPEPSQAQAPPESAPPANAAVEAASGGTASSVPDPVFKPEPTSEPKAEPTPEAMAEPNQEATAEPIPEPTSGPTSDATPEPTPEPPEAAAEAAPRESTPEIEAERREILEFFQSLSLRNHFEVLGAARGSSDADLRRAHVALVKRYHPDMRREEYLEDLHDVLEAIFIRVGEAWEVLGDAKSRSAYEARLGPVPRPSEQEKPSPPSPEEPVAEDEEVVEGLGTSPEETLTRARILLGQAKYWDAIQMLETAVPHLRQQDQHRGNILLARAYAENPKWVHKAVETLQDVIGEDPKNAEAYYELGRLYKASGLTARARAAYRRVLELRPGNSKAAAELGDQEPEEGGLLRRLFGGGDKSA
jgi:curved DNA-binding protein CbpA